MSRGAPVERAPRRRTSTTPRRRTPATPRRRTSTTPRRRAPATPSAGAAALATAAAAVLVLLAGCTAAPAPEGGEATTLAAQTAPVEDPAEPAADPALAGYYDQALTWGGCSADGAAAPASGEPLQCAVLTVPVDWSAPASGDLGLALVRAVASGDADRRLGSLVVDPGGPGVSGVDWVEAAGGAVVGEDLRERFDVVGLDPRGVGASDPVECLDDADLDAYLAGDATGEGATAADAEGAGAPPSAAEAAEARRQAGAFAAGCQADAGALLAHVDTTSAARDLDVLRAALGQDRLDYLGKSWGTLLGAAYADLFPQRVGRVVLDGALDPASSYADLLVGQAEGLEASLTAYASACGDRSDCPLDDDPAVAVQQVGSVIDAARARPLRTGTARPLTASLAFSGIITPLYDDASWPVLDTALAQALDGDGSGLLALADRYADRSADGSYASNRLQAFIAVTCLDYPVDDSPAAQDATAQRLSAAAPVLGPSMAHGEATCGSWPVPPTRVPGPLDAAGADPVLVVGTTGDPVTPYRWARALADQLDSGRLLTWDGEGHTAYGRGDACVDAAVDGYLLDGVLPGEGATCTA